MSTDWHSLERQLSHADNDKRIQALQSLESLLEQQSAPCLLEPVALATSLKSSLKSNNSHVSNAALRVLAPYFDQLIPHTSDSPLLAHHLKQALSTLLPGILEKLGDSKLPTRESAREALVSASRANLRLGIQTTTKEKEPAIWSLIEDGIREIGFESKNAKAREQALIALLEIRTPPNSIPEYPLPPLKPFTPLLLPLLADSDPSVRSTALSTTISIFSARQVSTAAKTDLKKAMAKLDLPKKVQDTVLQSVLAGGGGGGVASSFLEKSPSQNSSEERGSTSSSPPSALTPAPSGPATRTRTRAALSSSTSASSSTSTPSLLSSLPAAAFPSDPTAIHAPSSGNSVEPVYLASVEDLRREFEKMKPCFEGKETEHNWIERDRSVAVVRGMIEGGVTKQETPIGDLREEFVKCIKEIQEGIIKTSSSLRTTLAISALTLLSSLCTSLPPSLVDTLLDPFLSHCLSMASQTKKIVASASQTTVEKFIQHSSYHHKTIQSLLSGMSDKVVGARQYYSSHLITFIQSHTNSATTTTRIDQSGGTDDLISAIKKGLSDPNAGVRENSRRAYWAFEKVWTDRAEKEIREELDAQAKKLLDKVRPTGGGHGEKKEVESSARPKPRAALTSREAPTASGSAKKPTIREAMLAAKKKKLAEEAEAAQQQDQLVEPSTAVTPSKPSRPRPRPQILPEPETSTTQSEAQTRPRAISTSSNDSLSQQARDSEVDDSQQLQNVESPFEAPLSTLPPPSDYETPSRTARLGKSSPSRSMDTRRTPATPISLPVLEPVVDESLRDQAMQAEQTAERLLEIAQEEQEDATRSKEGSSSPIDNRSITPRPFEKEKASNGVSTAANQHTPLNGGKLLFGRRSRGNDVFQDSPDPRDGTGGIGRGSWWMKKAENVEVTSEPLPVDSEARTEEINNLVSSLQSLEIDTNDLKKLSAVSRERPVRRIDDDEPEQAEGVADAARWWREGRRFEKVYEGIKKQLLHSESIGSSRDMALIVLRDLVENQLPCLSGEEAGVFELIFQLREDPSRTTIAATESIATSLVSRLDPVYGLGALQSAVDSYLSSTATTSEAKARSFALALKLVGNFFEFLPAEVLEDVVPQTKELIKQALNDQTSGDLRRAAINALVSAQSVLRDEKRLTEMVDGLAPDQANLLSYYCAKRGV